MEKPNQNPSERKPFHLEELEKKNIFQVPEGYFDTLPTRIQSRVVKPRWESGWSFGWAGWATGLATAVMIVIGFWFFNGNQPGSTETVLAKVSNQELINYLQDSEVTQSEIIETVSADGSNPDENLFQQLDVPEDELIEQLSTQDVEDFI